MPATCFESVARYSLLELAEAPVAPWVERQWLIGFVPRRVVASVADPSVETAAVAELASPAAETAGFAAWSVAAGEVAAVVAVAALRTVVEPMLQREDDYQPVH